ncbi:MAG TPA: hypothetical protein VH206_17550 [Xanthobacteraceae bacterium]|jgi:hypothetical protein|nr:hypothetical protein [Xanthobacteraceae bacterium]
MSETIQSANAAASTLFLGHNGEWWDFWLIVSVVFASLAAIAIGISTTGSIVSHKREAAAAEVALDRFKLITEGKIADANAAGDTAKADAERARAEAAKATEQAAKIEQAAAWRVLSADSKFKLMSRLQNGSGRVEISYPANDPEALYLAAQIEAVFKKINAGKSPLPWNIEIQPRQFSRLIAFELRIFGTDPAAVGFLKEAFSFAQIPYVSDAIPNVLNDSPGMLITGGPPAPVTIFVGSKLPPT